MPLTLISFQESCGVQVRKELRGEKNQIAARPPRCMGRSRGIRHLTHRPVLVASSGG